MQIGPSTHMAAAPGADMSGLANLMAMKGRKGDNTLVHMSKAELPYLNMLARSAGHPQGLPVNPKTGLPEANILKSILPIAGSILGGMFLAPMLPFAGALATGVGAGLGSFGGGLLGGQSLKDAAIGGLISGGLSGLGAATFGGQDLLGTAPAQASQEAAKASAAAGIADDTLIGASANFTPPGPQFDSSLGMPEFGAGTDFGPVGVPPKDFSSIPSLMPPYDSAYPSGIFPRKIMGGHGIGHMVGEQAFADLSVPMSGADAYALELGAPDPVDLIDYSQAYTPRPEVAKLPVFNGPAATASKAVPNLTKAVSATKLPPPDLTQEIGFTDMDVLYNYRPEIPKLDYLKYAAKPAMTAGAAGLGVDAALERGAFEPIDYSSYYDAAEVEGPSPLPKRGLRFESERTGAFPRSAEEALAFAQPGGGRQRFFNQRFALPAKTGGGIAALQTGGRTALEIALGSGDADEDDDFGGVGEGIGFDNSFDLDSANTLGNIGTVAGLGLGVPGLGPVANALGQVGQYYSAPPDQRGSLRFEPLSVLPFTGAPTIGQQHTNLTTQHELNAPLEADQATEAAAAQAAALASTLSSIDQATIDEAEQAAPAPATAAAFGLADTEAAAQGAVAAAQAAATAQANAAQGLATLEAGIGGPGAGAGIGGPGAGASPGSAADAATSGLGIDVSLGIDDYAGFTGYGDYGDASEGDVGGIGSGSGPGGGFGDEGFGGIGGEDADADADSDADADGEDSGEGADSFNLGGLVQLPQGGLISAYQMGGSPSPYFEGRVMGPGDGMSDSIPFSIEGQQPAILSRDEYVLPADIVSMMGNGSSDAGAGKIDSFINDFRVQKYGRGEQPPETTRGLSSIR